MNVSRVTAGFATIAFLATVAMAQNVGPKHQTAPPRTLAGIAAIAFNAAEAARTVTVTDIQGWSLITFYVEFAWVDATEVIMTCDVSDDDGVLWFDMQSCAVASGNCTSSDVTFTRAVTATKQWTWRLDINTLADRVRCIFSGTEAAAGGDTVTVGYRKGVS